MGFREILRRKEQSIAFDSNHSEHLEHSPSGSGFEVVLLINSLQTKGDHVKVH